MKKYHITIANKIVVGIFCLIIILGFVGVFFGKSLPMSELQENRTLARIPTLNDLDRPLELPILINNYFADNFGFRKLLLWSYFKLRTQVLHAHFGLHSIEGVDGWVFLDAELSDYRRLNHLNPTDLKSIQIRLEAWCNYGLSVGARTLLLIGPNKSTIYPEKMPEFYQSFGGVSRIDQVLSSQFSCPLIMIDPRERLKSDRDELLYYKWGTHWNALAGIKVWQEIVLHLRSVGVSHAWPSTRPLVSWRPASPNEDSIWAWYGADDPEIVQIPKVDFVPINDGLNLELTSQPPRLLGIGDSFLQYIASTTTGFFGPFELVLPDTKYTPESDKTHLNALLFSRRNDFNVQETVKQFKPNIILFEVVERNIKNLAELMPPPGSFEIFDVNTPLWSSGIGSNSNKPSAVIIRSKDGSDLSVGDTIVFSKSGERTIIGITEVLSNRYTILLDKSVDLTDGYPNLVSVVKLKTTIN